MTARNSKGRGAHRALHLSQTQAIRKVLDNMEDDSLALIEYTELLVVLTTGPDATTAIDGIHRLMHVIMDHAGNIKKQWEALREIEKQCA
jgi:hypothetical protein